jgi:hypothetical protein
MKQAVAGVGGDRDVITGWCSIRAKTLSRDTFPQQCSWAPLRSQSGWRTEESVSQPGFPQLLFWRIAQVASLQQIRESKRHVEIDFRALRHRLRSPETFGGESMFGGHSASHRYALNLGHDSAIRIPVSTGTRAPNQSLGLSRLRDNQTNPRAVLETNDLCWIRCVRPQHPVESKR